MYNTAIASIYSKISKNKTIIEEHILMRWNISRNFEMMQALDLSTLARLES